MEERSASGGWGREAPDPRSFQRHLAKDVLSSEAYSAEANQAASHRANNFDTLRILAALAVICAHSIPLTYGPGVLDALWGFSHGQATLGFVAIQVFFIISGYLITASYRHRPEPRRFIRARFLRLVPALLAVLWLLAFAVGPLVSTLPLSSYFASLLPYRAALGLSDHLPGVFAHKPFSSGINGSLWTLRYEALCYLAVLLLGLAGWLKRLPVLAIFIVLLAARLRFGSGPVLEFGALFFAGAVLQFWQPRLAARYAVPCAILWLLALKFGFYTLAADTVGAYLVIYLGLAPGVKLPNLARHGDFSYGVYIFAWPVQQILSPHVGWVGNIAITVPVVLGLAFLSWHGVEAPALHLKNRKLLGV